MVQRNIENFTGNKNQASKTFDSNSTRLKYLLFFTNSLINNIFELINKGFVILALVSFEFSI